MIGSVVRTGFLNLRRDRAALILSFIVPIVFFSIFATIFGGSRKNGTTKVPLAIADEDQSDRSRQLIAALGREALKPFLSAEGETRKFDANSAEAYVKAGKVSVALVIPKGFGESKLSFGPRSAGRPSFRILADSSDPIAPQIVSGLLQKAVMTALPDAMLAGGVEQLDRYSGGLTPSQKTALDANIAGLRTRRQASGGAAAPSQTASPVDIQMKDVIGATKQNPMIAFYAAGIGVMFLLFTATNAGGALLEEYESGTLDRILTTRVSLSILLFGKLAYLWSLGMLQLLIMFIWGAVVFHLDLLGHLPGFVIMATVTALACSSFGLLIASVSRTRAQLSAISTLTVLTISAIGGSMFPRFLMPESFQKAGLVLFNSWAIEGFTKVFWREEPLRALLPQVAFLVASAVIFFAIARQVTRRWEIS